MAATFRSGHMAVNWLKKLLD